MAVGLRNIETHFPCLPPMDSLNDTAWDVVIDGTGLPQSLLALWVLQTCTDIRAECSLTSTQRLYS